MRWGTCFRGFLLFALLLLGGCSDRDSNPEVEKIAANFKQFKSVAARIKDCKSLTLYEGLPHQAWEEKELKNELANKTTIRLNGEFAFYAETLRISAEDTEKLQQLCSAPSSF